MKEIYMQNYEKFTDHLNYFPNLEITEEPFIMLHSKNNIFIHLFDIWLESNQDEIEFYNRIPKIIETSVISALVDDMPDLMVQDFILNRRAVK